MQHGKQQATWIDQVCHKAVWSAHICCEVHPSSELLGDTNDLHSLDTTSRHWSRSTTSIGLDLGGATLQSKLLATAQSTQQQIVMQTHHTFLCCTCMHVCVCQLCPIGTDTQEPPARVGFCLILSVKQIGDSATMRRVPYRDVSCEQIHMPSRYSPLTAVFVFL